MHDTSARLVERVLPAASYRQWVLTVPFPLQLRIARDLFPSQKVHPDREGRTEGPLLALNSWIQPILPGNE